MSGAGHEYYPPNDVSRGPFEQHVAASEPPMQVLLRSGIVQQRAKCHSFPVLFDPKRQTSETARFFPQSQFDDRPARQLHELGVSSTAVKDLVLVPPPGVIRVLGNFDASFFSASTNTQRPAAEVSRKQHQSVKKFQEYAAQRKAMLEGSLALQLPLSKMHRSVSEDAAIDLLDHTTMAQSLGAGDAVDPGDSSEDDEEFYERHWILTCRQFLETAIPMVASRCGAIVILRPSRNDAAAQLIARGAARRWPAVNHDPSPMLLGILGCRRDGDHRQTTGFTHLIYVDQEQHSVGSTPIIIHMDRTPAKSSRHFSSASSVSTFSKFSDPLASYTMNVTSALASTPAPSSEGTFVMGQKAVCVLIGGAKGDVEEELLHFVKNQWPIFIIEHSGGYASVLCSVIRRIEQLHPNPSLDNYRSFLASADPATAEILINGRTRIVSVGTDVATFAMDLELAISGTRTLQHAWEKYALWSSNARHFDTMTYNLQVWSLVIGLFATLLSIWQTFAQLQWPDVAAEGTNESPTNAAAHVYQYINIALIILPIFVSLLQAVMMKVQPTIKWATLRRCAEILLREIYMYRTETLKYSCAEIIASQRNVPQATADPQEDEKEPQQPVKSSASNVTDTNFEVDESIIDTCWADTEPYESRDELLHRRIQALTNEVIEHVSGSTLDKYTGSLPPENIKNLNDDGFSSIGPDQYVEIRLRGSVARYTASASRHGWQLWVLNVFIYMFGALGSVLAAVAFVNTARPYNLQAWVALTAAVQSGLSRFVDYSRVEWMYKMHSKTGALLSNAESWWTQLQQPGQETDSQANRDKLVRRVEAIVSTEVEATGEQLRNIVERMRKAQEAQQQELQDVTGKLARGEDVDQVKQLRAAGFDKLDASTISAALQQPTGEAAATLKNVLYRLQDQLDLRVVDDVRPQWLDDVTAKAAEAVQQGTAAVNELGQMKDAALQGMRIAELAPSEIVEAMRDPLQKRKLFGALESIDAAKPISRQQLLQSLSGAANGLRKEFTTAIREMSHRQLLSSARNFMTEKLTADFESALNSMNLGLYDLLSTKKEMQVLMSELRIISRTNWRVTPIVSVLGLIKDSKVAETMGKLGEANVRAILKRAEKFFVGPSAQVLDVVLRDSAKLDVQELCQTSAARIERSVLREKVIKMEKKTPLDLLSKKELVELLPMFLRVEEDIIAKPQLQLAFYVRAVARSSQIDHVVAAASRELQQHAKEEVRHVVKSAWREFATEKFATEKWTVLAEAVIDVPFMELYEAGKDGIIRTLCTHPMFTQQMTHELRMLPEEVFKHMVGVLKSFVCRTYQMEAFAKVSDEIIAFRLSQVVSTAELQIALIDQVQQLRGSAESVSRIEKKEILSAVASPPLIAVLQKLSVEQLREIVESVLFHTSDVYSLRLIASSAQLTGRSSILEEAFPQLRPWTDYTCLRFLHAFRIFERFKQIAVKPVSQLQRRDLVRDCVDVKLLQGFPDNELSDALQQLHEDQAAEMLVMLLEMPDDVSTQYVSALLKSLDGNCPLPIHRLADFFSSLPLIEMLVKVAATFILNPHGDENEEGGGDRGPSESVDAECPFTVSWDYRRVEKMRKIWKWAEDSGEPSDQLSVLLRESLQLSDENLALMYSAACQELQWNGHLFFFDAVVKECTSFHLRSLMSDVATQLDLVSAFCLFHTGHQRQQGEHVEAAELERDDAPDSLSATSSAQEKLVQSRTEEMSKFDSEIAADTTFLDFVANQPDFEDLECALFLLRPGDVQKLIKALEVVFDSSPVARAVADITRHERGAGAAWFRVARHLRAAMRPVRVALERNEKVVREELFRLDIAVFLSQTEDLREKKLGKYIASSGTLRYVATMPTHVASYILKSLDVLLPRSSGTALLRCLADML